MLFESGGILPLVFALADEICATASGERGEVLREPREADVSANRQIWRRLLADRPPKLSRSTTRPP